MATFVTVGSSSDSDGFEGKDEPQKQQVLKPFKRSPPSVSRKPGLSPEEQRCMCRLPAPSPACAANLRLWALGADAEGQPLSLPSRQTSKHRTRPVNVTTDLGERALASEPDEEELCASIIQRLFPVPERKVIPKPRLVVTPENSGTRFFRPKRANIAIVPMTPNGSLVRPGRGLRARAEVVVIDERFKLLRKGREWDASIFPMEPNSIRLVQGAHATRLERVMFGKIQFVNEEEEPTPSKTFDKGAERRVRKEVIQGNPLIQFRDKLTSKFGTIETAFHAIDGLMPKTLSKQLGMHDFSHNLHQLGLCSVYDGRIIYELMDTDKDGHLSLYEFQVGVTTVASVSDVACLRKRLLCLGFPCMLAAISAMHGPIGSIGSIEDTTMRPLTLPQFGDVLTRVWVLDQVEHSAVFHSIRDPNDPSFSVTLGELMCGLTAVAPCMLLEDLSMLCVSKHGSIAVAMAALEKAAVRLIGPGTRDKTTGEVSLGNAEQFAGLMQELFGFTTAEAKKLLPRLDADSSGDVCISEVRGVLALCAPSLPLEDCRKRLQLSYRSIENAFKLAFPESPEVLTSESLLFTPDELQELLQPVEGVTVSEMQRIIKFMSSSSDKGLSINSLLKGVRLFAPCAVLEGLRLQLMAKNAVTANAFRHIPDRRKLLDKVEFAAVLDDMGIQFEESELNEMFDFLDVRHAGVVTIAELIAMLQCSHFIARKWMKPAERERKAEKSVREEFASLHGVVSELKACLRKSSSKGKGGEEATLAPQRSSSSKSKSSAMQRSASTPGTPGPNSSSLAAVPSPTLRQPLAANGARSLATGAPASVKSQERLPIARRTFQKITSTLSLVPASPEMDIISEELTGYFYMSQAVMSKHAPLLEQGQKQIDDHRLANERRRKTHID